MAGWPIIANILLLVSFSLQAKTIYLTNYYLEKDDAGNSIVVVRSVQDLLHCEAAVIKDKRVVKVFKDINFPQKKRVFLELGFQWGWQPREHLTIKVSSCRYIRPLTPVTNYRPASERVDRTIQSALDFLWARQKKDGNQQRYFKGEWGSQMVARKGFAVLLTKKGTRAYDSNCFTTSSIVNVLANIYRSKIGSEQQAKIRQMLQLALTDVLACEEGGTFNFWHRIDIPKHLQRPGKVNRVRSPNNFPYKKRLFYFFSNVVNDADDTAIAYMALENIRRILGIDRKPQQQIGDIFSAYRDLKSRHVLNIYDLVALRPKHTEAFMTWLSHDEKIVPSLPNFSRQNIPMRTNDVDCVVNSNILTALAVYDELESTEGVEQSCHYLRKELRRKKFSKCALYYPNTYMFPYAASKALHAGVKCLRPVRQRMIDLVLARQKTDGSWDSFKEYDDIVQSTILAVNTLLNLYQGEKKLLMAIERGVNFILSQVQHCDKGDYWPGGIYFSGGTFARKKIVWTSDAYTTALAVEILVKYKQLSNEVSYE